MNTPKVGQLVYVVHLSLHFIEHPSLKISEREFYRTATPSYARGALRWVVGPPGKSKHEGASAPFGTAYKPESVFETREAAQASANEKLEVIITNLRALQA